MKIKRIDEASTSRLYKNFTDENITFAIISGERPDDDRTNELKKDVRNLNLGFNEFIGRWVEDGINYDEDGVKLGFWIITQRRVYKGLKTGVITQEQIDLLNKIEMVWDIDLSRKICDLKEQKWNILYNLAKKYYEENGNLSVVAGFRTFDGINYDKEGFNLGSWVNLQRLTYMGKLYYSIKDEHIELLEKIGMEWYPKKFDKKLQKEGITKKNKNRKEIEILSRFKSSLLNYDSNTLPNKEEINDKFIKQLKI